jgi:predicted patatin/cPLA2 family phospholipase
MRDDIGLILEGGGMRGAYTAGVLDFFRDIEIDFPLVSTASSGAFIGSYYIAKQQRVNYKIFNEIMGNPRSISIRRMLTHKEVFSMNFIFDKIPRELVPFDFQSFSKSNTKFLIGTTDIVTGKPHYHDTYDTKDDLLTIIRASSSLPVLAPVVSFKGKELVDGGVSDPIPIRPSIQRGYQKHVVVLTRNKGYIKKGIKLNWFFKHVFKNYPGLREILKERHKIYNQTMEHLKEMEKQNKVFIIQPKERLVAKRLERNKQILHDLYFQGYQEAEQKKLELQQFLKS